MTHGETLYLALVLGVFGAFAFVIAYLSHEYARDHNTTPAAVPMHRLPPAEGKPI